MNEVIKEKKGAKQKTKQGLFEPHRAPARTKNHLNRSTITIPLAKSIPYIKNNIDMALR